MSYPQSPVDVCMRSVGFHLGSRFSGDRLKVAEACERFLQCPKLEDTAPHEVEYRILSELLVNGYGTHLWDLRGDNSNDSTEDEAPARAAYLSRKKEANKLLSKLVGNMGEEGMAKDPYSHWKRLRRSVVQKGNRSIYDRQRSRIYCMRGYNPCLTDDDIMFGNSEPSCGHQKVRDVLTAELEDNGRQKKKRKKKKIKKVARMARWKIEKPSLDDFDFYVGDRLMEYTENELCETCRLCRTYWGPFHEDYCNYRALHEEFQTLLLINDRILPYLRRLDYDVADSVSAKYLIDADPIKVTWRDYFSLLNQYAISIFNFGIRDEVIFKDLLNLREDVRKRWKLFGSGSKRAKELLKKVLPDEDVVRNLLQAKPDIYISDVTDSLIKGARNNPARAGTVPDGGWVIKGFSKTVTDCVGSPEKAEHQSSQAGGTSRSTSNPLQCLRCKKSVNIKHDRDVVFPWYVPPEMGSNRVGGMTTMTYYNMRGYLGGFVEDEKDLEETKSEPQKPNPIQNGATVAVKASTDDKAIVNLKKSANHGTESGMGKKVESKSQTLENSEREQMDKGDLPATNGKFTDNVKEEVDQEKSEAIERSRSHHEDNVEATPHQATTQVDAPEEKYIKDELARQEVQQVDVQEEGRHDAGALAKSGTPTAELENGVSMANGDDEMQSKGDVQAASARKIEGKERVEERTSSLEGNIESAAGATNEGVKDCNEPCVFDVSWDANYHATPVMNAFHEWWPADTFVYSQRGREYVEGIGKIMLELRDPEQPAERSGQSRTRILLNQVLFVPSLTRPRLSIPKIVQSGQVIKFHEGKLVIEDRNGGRLSEADFDENESSYIMSAMAVLGHRNDEDAEASSQSMSEDEGYSSAEDVEMTADLEW